MKKYFFRCKKTKNGFSLVELLIYVAIFTVSAVFLVSILTVVTRIQLKQTSVHEVNQQISFVGSTIKNLVQTSSLINMTAGSPTSTLTLIMSSSSIDQTLVYASGTIMYLEQRDVDGVVTTLQPLTDSNVTVDNFLVTKYENPGGYAILQVDLSMSYNTSNPQAQVTRSLKTAIGRISAAQFDSSVYPNVDNSFDLGTATYNWKDAYFAGSVGIGVSPPASNAKLKTSGNIGFSTSSVGLVLVSPNGTCFRLGVSNAGVVTTSTATCP